MSHSPANTVQKKHLFIPQEALAITVLTASTLSMSMTWSPEIEQASVMVSWSQSGSTIREIKEIWSCMSVRNAGKEYSIWSLQMMSFSDLSERWIKSCNRIYLVYTRGMILLWWDEKNTSVQDKHSISFEDIERAVRSGRLLWIRKHPNALSYPHQVILYVDLDDYVCVVPCVPIEGWYFMKTAYRSRVATKYFP